MMKNVYSTDMLMHKAKKINKNPERQSQKINQQNYGNNELLFISKLLENLMFSNISKAYADCGYG